MIGKEVIADYEEAKARMLKAVYPDYNDEKFNIATPRLEAAQSALIEATKIQFNKIPEADKTEANKEAETILGMFDEFNAYDRKRICEIIYKHSVCNEPRINQLKVEILREYLAITIA